MPVPANPKMSDVCTEFGAPITTPLSAFLRGGAWVANNAANAAVPTALPIRLSQLAGAVDYITLTGFASPNPAHTLEFRSEPAPGSLVVNSATTAQGVDGSGVYTYAWSYLSGDATIAGVGASNVAAKSWTATVDKNTTKTALWRCVVDDGVMSVNVDVTVSLQYETDL